MQALIPGATQRKSPNFWADEYARDPRAVVLHTSMGSYTSCINHFMNPLSEVSAHLVIGQAGELAQTVPLDERAWTNGLRWSGSGWLTPVGRRPVRPTWTNIIPGVNPNLYTVTIELAGFSKDPIGPSMRATLIRALQFIAAQFHMWYEPRRTLIGHNEINPVDKPNCPGPRVDFAGIARDANTLWFATPQQKKTSQACVIYQAPDVHSKTAGTLQGGDLFVSDAISIGRGYNKFYHLQSGQGFIHEEDVVR